MFTVEVVEHSNDNSIKDTYQCEKVLFFMKLLTLWIRHENGSLYKEQFNMESPDYYTIRIDGENIESEDE